MVHGSLSTYANHKCRCDTCRAAQSTYMREYKERRKANSGERLTQPLTPEQLSKINVERVKRWREANPEKHKENIRRYGEKHRDVLRERSLAQWRKRKEIDPERLKEIQRKYRTSEKGRAYQRVQNYRRRSLPMSIEVRDWWLEQMNSSAVCSYCWAALATEIDHIIPVTKGGTNELDNLTPCCRSCNSSKGNKNLAEWLERVA